MMEIPSCDMELPPLHMIGTTTATVTKLWRPNRPLQVLLEFHEVAHVTTIVHCKGQPVHELSRQSLEVGMIEQSYKC